MTGRQLVFRLVVVAVQFLLVVAGLELGLRLLKPHQKGIRQLLYRSTEATKFEEISTLKDLMNRSPVGFRPGAEEEGFVLNSKSFRTKEYLEAKAEDGYRVLAIGDSFTYGVVPDADHWTTLLAAGLSDASMAEGKTVEVLRLGVPGTGTPFQLRLWQLEGRRLNADLVVLAFFVGNDFQDELGSAPGFAGNNIRHVDLLPYFRARHEEGRLYLLQDSHWNREGNRLAAEILALGLKKPSARFPK